MTRLTKTVLATLATVAIVVVWVAAESIALLKGIEQADM